MSEKDDLVAALAATGADDGEITAWFVRWFPFMGRARSRQFASDACGLDSGDMYGRHPAVEAAAEALWDRRWIRGRLLRRIWRAEREA